MGIIRLTLAIAVVIAHSSTFFGLQTVGGRVAVESFYIISGFYMTLILKQKYNKPGTYSLFITNRFLRLFPAYWLILILSLITSLSFLIFSGDYLLLEEFKGISLSVFSVVSVIISEIIIFGQDIFMFLGFDNTNGSFFLSERLFLNDIKPFNFFLVPQAWTLSCELMFYIIAPIISVRKYLAIAVMAGSLSIRYVLFINGHGAEPWTYRFFPSELMFFCTGILAWYLYSYYETKKIPSRKTISLIFFGSISLFTLFFDVIPDNLWVLPQRFLMFNDAFFLLTFKMWIYYGLIFLGIPFLFSLTANNKIDQNIGELSYPVYISHVLILTIIKHTFPANLMSYFGELTILLTLIFSLMLWRFFIKPIEKFRHTKLQVLST